jgi:transcriptional regulator with XRE-family HTH domain
MKRHEKPRSEAIKNYYEGLRYSAGITSKDLAERIGMTAVNFSNLTTRLDQLTGEKLAIVAKSLGVEPGVFLNKILELRANELDA